MCERVSLPQAAKEIGVAPQLIRERMQLDKSDPRYWDLGEVIPSKTGKPNARNTYLIFRAKLDKFLGKER